MKKNLAARLGVLALVLTLVTSSLVSGTYSKYVSTQAGADTARVAKFAFNLTSLNGKSGSTATTAINQSASSVGTYDIFSYTDTGVYGNGLNGAAKFIAPGTTGSFTVTVENLSEVKVAATFALAEQKSSSDATASIIPVYYTINSATQRYSSVLTASTTYNSSPTAPDTGKYKTLADMATDMAALSGMSSIAATNVSSGGPTGSAILHWTWAFDNTNVTGSGTASGQTDVGDTTLGTTTTAPTVYLKISTTVTQLDT